MAVISSLATDESCPTLGAGSPREPGGQTGTGDAALVSGFVALIVVVVTQRSTGRIAADDRRWDTCAALYLDLIQWLEQDVEALRARAVPARRLA